METQLITPSPDVNLNFDSTSTSPFATAPSSPNIFSGLSPINHDVAGELQSTVPLTRWEEDDTEFAFDFSGQLETPLISDADELFSGGKIKSLKPPSPPRSPILSPKSNKKIYSDSFSEAFNQTPIDQTQNPPQRGRNRTMTTTITTGSMHKVSRSLSPMRVSDILSNDQKISTNQSSPFGFTWYNKWNFKNLLLFRSTSEGSAMITKNDQDVKHSSFRSTDNGGSAGGSRRRIRRKLSAHEIHYTANRAAAEEMKRKTFLPYKSGLLGCLGFVHNGGSLR